MMVRIRYILRKIIFNIYLLPIIFCFQNYSYNFFLKIQYGDEGGVTYNRNPYSDYTDYQPVNTAYKVRLLKVNCWEKIQTFFLSKYLYFFRLSIQVDGNRVLLQKVWENFSFNNLWLLIMDSCVHTLSKMWINLKLGHMEGTYVFFKIYIS